MPAHAPGPEQVALERVQRNLAPTRVDFRTDIRDGTATGWRITAEQPIYNPERRASARQLEMHAGRAEIQMQASRQDLMLRTARAYFEVLLSEDALEEVRRQKAAAARALEVTQASYDEGKLPITDQCLLPSCAISAPTRKANGHHGQLPVASANRVGWL